MSPPNVLTHETLIDAVEALTIRDRTLAGVVERHGPPPLWSRKPGFPTLIHIMLEQQVSLASARSVFERLCAVVAPLTPDGFMALDDAQLKTIGFSRQKTHYGRELANAIITGGLDLDRFTEAADDVVRCALKEITGIGEWTAEIYLLMALRRPDAFPRSDLALQVAAQALLGLATRPRPDELGALAEDWRPYRAVAARLLWHAYLSAPRKRHGDVRVP